MAFDKMERDFEQHKEIFMRLENDLAAVKLFEQPDYTEALAAMRRQDSALYAAIRDAYEKGSGDVEDHCQGIIAAVNAIYNLGFSNGFKMGAENAGKEKLK